MSVRIFLDVEEAISREVRRITFHQNRTLDKVVLQDTFDPFTGERVPAPIEANFYDSSADTNNIQYPHFFVKLLKTREDRFSGREVVNYGKRCVHGVIGSSGAYDIKTQGQDGLITAVGNTINTGIYKIARVQANNYIRLLDGNNKGTYIVNSIVIDNNGNHQIIVSNDIVRDIPGTTFNSSRQLFFDNIVDLNTVKIGDTFVDSINNSFIINSIDVNKQFLVLGGITSPNYIAGGKIVRIGNVFSNTDLSLVKFLVLDQMKPIYDSVGESKAQEYVGVSPAIALDTYYMVRIDSRTRQNHIDVLNRIWEEFNPPRTALPVIERTSLSAEQPLTSDLAAGGSDLISVADTSNFHAGDKVVIIDNFHPTKRVDGEGFERPFESEIIDIVNGQLKLADVVPDTYKVENDAKIISNTNFSLLMFHFVDHATKDIEGAQYWVHEFTFWVQVWVDRLESAKSLSAITNVLSSIEDLDNNVVIED